MSEDFFGTLGKNVSDFFKNIAEMIRISIECKKINREITEEKSSIVKNCQDIGKIIYKNKERFNMEEWPDIEPLVKSIEDSELEIKDLSEEIEQVKNSNSVKNAKKEQKAKNGQQAKKAVISHKEESDKSIDYYDADDSDYYDSDDYDDYDLDDE